MSKERRQCVRRNFRRSAMLFDNDGSVLDGCMVADLSVTLEHFSAKWEPRRRRKCDKAKEKRAHSDSIETGSTLVIASR
ncbi:MAG: hypothetical protein HY056_15840 [Proteobacteria bacterium]|nr:hypothetical protein [Pseudomonadota bacterium]